LRHVAALTFNHHVIMVNAALTNGMRRILVLTDETARHWFRASLPPGREVTFDPVPFNARQLFWLTFTAAFMAFYGFLS
jgi:hypothetical protein